MPAKNVRSRTAAATLARCVAVSVKFAASAVLEPAAVLLSPATPLANDTLSARRVGEDCTAAALPVVLVAGPRVGVLELTVAASSERFT